MTRPVVPLDGASVPLRRPAGLAGAARDHRGRGGHDGAARPLAAERVELKHFSLQNFGYAIQWWLFSVFAVVFWGRLMRDQLAAADEMPEPEQPVDQPVAYRRYVMPTVAGRAGRPGARRVQRLPRRRSPRRTPRSAVTEQRARVPAARRAGQDRRRGGRPRCCATGSWPSSPASC